MLLGGFAAVATATGLPLATLEIMQKEVVRARLQADRPDVLIDVNTAGFAFHEFYRPRELMRRVKVIGTARRRVPSRWFELIGGALMQRKRLWLRYFKRSDRTESEREVSPQRLVHHRGTWYLDAWCHASDGLRRFALDAVRDAKALEPRAKSVPLRELEAVNHKGRGVRRGVFAIA